MFRRCGSGCSFAKRFEMKSKEVVMTTMLFMRMRLNMVIAPFAHYHMDLTLPSKALLIRSNLFCSRAAYGERVSLRIVENVGYDPPQLPNRSSILLTYSSYKEIIPRQINHYRGPYCLSSSNECCFICYTGYTENDFSPLKSPSDRQLNLAVPSLLPLPQPLKYFFHVLTVDQAPNFTWGLLGPNSVTNVAYLEWGVQARDHNEQLLLLEFVVHCISELVQEVEEWRLRLEIFRKQERVHRTISSIKVGRVKIRNRSHRRYWYELPSDHIPVDGQLLVVRVSSVHTVSKPIIQSSIQVVVMSFRMYSKISAKSRHIAPPTLMNSSLSNCRLRLAATSEKELSKLPNFRIDSTLVVGTTTIYDFSALPDTTCTCDNHEEWKLPGRLWLDVEEVRASQNMGKPGDSEYISTLTPIMKLTTGVCEQNLLIYCMGRNKFLSLLAHQKKIRFWYHH
ncbi:uncharacterized protein BDR25DRAFT_351250 [Lindgomyces ingoldianus]|uniref:Uncharacterized protein n=1 Tax=Lindgomyces ingoldianus TaxID=673940 RepID=A0ACB6R8S8_9PLEO|nr:uncharacterized protein BDR25DRAFT_351250 [Lindgomyces ingoldianus]KAF2474727.1 hypothetical protein BDR25DRAFT_351250 [Lindgomyces ingoldianus]